MDCSLIRQIEKSDSGGWAISNKAMPFHKQVVRTKVAGFVQGVTKISWPHIFCQNRFVGSPWFLNNFPK